jgi:hypothetical protein
MKMDPTQFAELIAGTEQHRDVNCRQVSNGFALAGNVRYLVPGTANVKVAQSFEAVATTAEAAAESLRNFLLTGDFRGNA